MQGAHLGHAQGILRVNQTGDHMAKEDILEFPGVVKELLPNATFRVELENGPASAFSQAIKYRLK